MLMTKVNCCCCAGVVVVAPWCCCYLLLLLVGIPDSDKNVSLRPPTATPHSDGMFSQRLMRRMRNVKAMARGKQRGGIVRFSMYIALYTHTHIRLSQSQGVSRLHELIDTGIGGIGGNKMCLPNNFICEKWHSWNIHAGKKKKKPGSLRCQCCQPGGVAPAQNFSISRPEPGADIEGHQDLLGCQAEWMKIEECSAVANCCNSMTELFRTAAE